MDAVRVNSTSYSALDNDSLWTNPTPAHLWFHIAFPQFSAGSCKQATYCFTTDHWYIQMLLSELLLEIFNAIEGTTFMSRRFTLEEWCGRAGNICQLAEAPPIEYASLPHFPHFTSKRTYTTLSHLYIHDARAHNLLSWSFIKFSAQCYMIRKYNKNSLLLDIYDIGILSGLSCLFLYKYVSR